MTVLFDKTNGYSYRTKSLGVSKRLRFINDQRNDQRSRLKIIYARDSISRDLEDFFHENVHLKSLFVIINFVRAK